MSRPSTSAMSDGASEENHFWTHRSDRRHSSANPVEVQVIAWPRLALTGDVWLSHTDVPLGVRPGSAMDRAAPMTSWLPTLKARLRGTCGASYQDLDHRSNTRSCFVTSGRAKNATRVP